MYRFAFAMSSFVDFMDLMIRQKKLPYVVKCFPVYDKAPLNTDVRLTYLTVNGS